MQVLCLPRLRAIAAVLAVGALTIAGLGSAAAAQRHYPRVVEQGFQTSCVRAATAVTPGKAKTKKKVAAKYCRYTLACIEQHLTLRQFSAHPYSKAVTACERHGARKAGLT